MMALTPHNLVAAALQAGALALAGAPLPRLLGIRSPRARLAYWRGLLLACLLLPMVQPAAPLPSALPDLPRFALEVNAVPGSATEVVTADRLPDAAIALVPLVLFGIAVRAGWLLFGLLGLRQVRRDSRVLAPRPSSVNEAASLARADAEFRLAPGAARPVTFGLLRPVVLVPSDFEEFLPEQQRAIACHELIHVRRHDWARTVGDEVLRAVLWFHPAVWWLTRQIRLSREQLIDREVVRNTGARRPYLDALVRLAAPARWTRLVPAPLFLGRSHLEDRIALLLKEVHMSRRRLAVSFVVMAALLALVGHTVVRALPLHAGTLALQQAGASRPGQVTPAPAGPGKKGLQTTTYSRVLFPAGSLEVPVIVSVVVDPSGAVSSATPVQGPADLAAAAVEGVKSWRFEAPGRATTFLIGFNPAAGGTDLAAQAPASIGPGVTPPAKTKDVKPVYPDEARKAGIQGMVIVGVRIAADGSVSDAQVLRSVPELDQAALAAILRWKFEAKGFPVRMTVTVNFQLGDGPKKTKEGLGSGVGAGVGGGVAGGVAGGVEGGVDDDLEALAAGERVVRIGGSVKPPQKTFDVKPVYPKEAQEARIEGIVVIGTVIGGDGKVKRAKVLRGIPELDQAALDAVRQWQFTPTVVDGKPVAVYMTITVNFTLQ